MKPRIIFILTLLFIPALSSGQADGYLGKRFLPYYNFAGTINWFTLFSEGVNFSSRHEIGLDYITGRKSMVGIELGHARMPFKIAPSYLPVESTTESTPFYKARFISNTVGLTFTSHAIHSANTPAPVGRYVKFKGYIGFNSFNDPYGQALRYFSYGTADPYFRPMSIAYSNIGVGAAIGQRQIVYDRLVLNMALNIDLTVFPTQVKVKEGKTLMPIDANEAYNLGTEMWLRHLGSFVMSYTIGLGGIL